jgi:CubicO group peptidase (beta-lactamase class C family)
VNSEILQPLGKADTMLRPTPEQQKRLAQRTYPHWPECAALAGLRLVRCRRTALDGTRHDQLWRGQSRS